MRVGAAARDKSDNSSAEMIRDETETRRHALPMRTGVRPESIRNNCTERKEAGTKMMDESDETERCAAGEGVGGGDGGAHHSS